jgi:hypothetical protein
MKKSKDSAEAIKISGKYYLFPAICSLVITTVIVVMIFLQNNAQQTIINLCSTFYNIGVTFSLTFIAFVITALALLQFLQSKEWFSEVSKSIYFKRFLKRFLYSVRMCIVFFITIIVYIVILNYNNILFCYISLSLFLLCLFFIVFWVWNCISDFIMLFQ